MSTGQNREAFVEVVSSRSKLEDAIVAMMSPLCIPAFRVKCTSNHELCLWFLFCNSTLPSNDDEADLRLPPRGGELLSIINTCHFCVIILRYVLPYFGCTMFIISLCYGLSLMLRRDFALCAEFSRGAYWYLTHQ